ncbi:hypothetical protein D3C87_1800070 [compost metagenome]
MSAHKVHLQHLPEAFGSPFAPFVPDQARCIDQRVDAIEALHRLLHGDLVGDVELRELDARGIGVFTIHAQRDHAPAHGREMPGTC